MIIFNSIKWLARRASRDTSSGQFIAELDGLRFLAILSVFLFHLSAYVTEKSGRHPDSDLLAAFLSHGDIGVALFFIISGFVIALPYAKGHFFGSKIPELKQFFLRRLSRLEPPYFVNLLVFFCLMSLFTPNKAADMAPNLFASMMYLHTLIFSKASFINVVAWSLEVELQFYLLAPFLTYLFAIRSLYLRRAILIGLILSFSLMNNLVSPLVSPVYALTLVCQAQYFFTGFLLLDVYLIDWQQNPQLHGFWDTVSVASWCSIAGILFFWPSARVLIVLPMFVAYCAAFKGRISNRFFRHPFVYTVGGMCYTIYLYHYLIISSFGRLLVTSGVLFGLPLWGRIILSTVILAPITLLICTLLFIAIEKPCMKRDWYLRFINFKIPGVKAEIE